MAEESKKGSAWWAVAVVLLLALLYALSVGPAAWLVNRTGRGVAVTKAVYAPLIWLRRHTLLKKPLGWYIDLWIGPQPEGEVN